MKHLYLFITLFAFAKVPSQTLTQAFNEPVIGDVDRNYRLDTSAYTTGLPLNVTGNNCVWNYTQLKGNFPMIVDSFVTPVGVPSASAYPTASYAQKRDNIYTYYKSSNSPQQTELLGGFTPTLSVTFTNSGIIAGYPVSYGYNVTDPVGGSFKYNTSTGACIGNISISADGLGTLNLPNNVTFTNVLRLKSVESLTLSYNILPFATFNQTIYNFYRPGVKFPVLNLNYTSYQFISGTPTITAFIYGSNNYFTVAGINGPYADNENISIYPNPFHNQLFIDANNAGQEPDCYFYDLNGKLALKTRTPTPGDLEKLVPGIYFVEVQTGQGIFHKKVIKN